MFQELYFENNSGGVYTDKATASVFVNFMVVPHSLGMYWGNELKFWSNIRPYPFTFTLDPQAYARIVPFDDHETEYPQSASNVMASGASPITSVTFKSSQTKILLTNETASLEL